VTPSVYTDSEDAVPQGDIRLQGEGLFRLRVRFPLLALVNFALLASIFGCNRPPSPDVVATVNGKQILRSELERNYRATVGDNPQETSPEQSNITRLSILDQMINYEIIQQRAAKLNLVASDEDVNAKLTEVKAPYTQEGFDKHLKEMGVTLDDFKRELRRNLTSAKLLNKEVESKIDITDAEIGGYYTAHKSEFNLIEPRYGIAQIVVTASP
jgi:peptidyl-prolyl cis-trans isomerase SurA